MAGDSHTRLRADGTREDLPAIWSFRVRSQDPDEDTRLETEFYARNQEISRMLEEKGFALCGDEPGGVLINRFLHLRKTDV